MISKKVVIFFTFAVALALIPYVKNPRDYLSEDFEEKDDYYEDDMILSRQQILNLYTTSWNGLDNEEILEKEIDYRWPNATVVFTISEQFSSEEIMLILEAMEEISDISCVKFAEKSRDNQYFVKILNGSVGCFSTVGYLEKERMLILAPWCFEKIGYLWHMLFHTLGFFHMHSSYDRDNYVTIFFKNIMENYTHNFRKYSKALTHYGVPYDYRSLMHYGRKAFSVNGKDTIVPVNPDAEIGQREKMTDNDIRRLNAMYKCVGDKLRE